MIPLLPFDRRIESIFRQEELRLSARYIALTFTIAYHTNLWHLEQELKERIARRARRE